MNSGWASSATPPSAVDGQAEVETWSSPALAQWLSGHSTALGPPAAPAPAGPMDWPAGPSPLPGALESLFGGALPGYAHPQSSLSSMQDGLPSDGPAPGMRSSSPGVAWNPSGEPPHLPYFSPEAGSQGDFDQSLDHTSSFAHPRTTFGSLSDASPAQAAALPHHSALPAPLPPSLSMQTPDLPHSPPGVLPMAAPEPSALAPSAGSLLWNISQPQMGVHSYAPPRNGAPSSQPQTGAYATLSGSDIYPSRHQLGTPSPQPAFGTAQAQAPGPSQQDAEGTQPAQSLGPQPSQAAGEAPPIETHTEPQPKSAVSAQPALSSAGSDVQQPSLPSATQPASVSKSPFAQAAHGTTTNGPPAPVPQPRAQLKIWSTSSPIAHPNSSSQPKATPLFSPMPQTKSPKSKSVLKSAAQLKLSSTVKTASQATPTPQPKPKAKKTCQCATMTDKVAADKRVKCLSCKTEHIVLCNLIRGEARCVNCRPDRDPRSATNGTKRPALSAPPGKTTKSKKPALPPSSRPGVRAAPTAPPGQSGTSALRYQAVRQLASAFAVILGEAGGVLDSSVLAARCLDAARRLETSLWATVVLSRDSVPGSSSVAGVAGQVKQRAAGLSASTSSVHALTRQKAKVAKYRDRLRILLVQLKNKRNTSLRQQISTGALSPERLAELTPDQLASESMRSLIATTRREKLASSVVLRESFLPESSPEAATEAESGPGSSPSASAGRTRPVERLPDAPPKPAPQVARSAKPAGVTSYSVATKPTAKSSLAPGKADALNRTTQVKRTVMTSKSTLAKASPRAAPAKASPKAAPAKSSTAKSAPKQFSSVSLDRLLSAVNAPPPPKEQEVIDKGRSAHRAAATDEAKGSSAQDHDDDDVVIVGSSPAPSTQADPPVRPDIAALLAKLEASMASLVPQTRTTADDGDAVLPHPEKACDASAASVPQEPKDSQADGTDCYPPSAPTLPDASAHCCPPSGGPEIGPSSGDVASGPTAAAAPTVSSSSIEALLQRLG